MIIETDDRKTIEEIVMTLQRREEFKERSKEELVKTKQSISEGIHPQNATEAILKLKAEGFFNSKKTLKEIQKKLEEGGFFYPLTTLSGLILNLVRRRELGRMRGEQEKNWTYVKR